jgi:hypothetical protein
VSECCISALCRLVPLTLLFRHSSVACDARALPSLPGRSPGDSHAIGYRVLRSAGTQQSACQSAL